MAWFRARMFRFKLAAPGVTVAVPFVLAACGGGGGDTGPPTVSGVTTSGAKYRQSLLVTISGQNLNQALRVTSPGCSGMARDDSGLGFPPSTTAKYRCTVSAVGASTVTVATTEGSVLGSANFTVPVPQVTMNVSNGAGVAGSLVITLDPAKTPLTVDNFLAYVNTRFYDGTVFHRSEPDFVIQGGGFLPLEGGAPVAKTPLNAPIALEVNRGLSNVQWSIAMVRGSSANSATSQFFINLKDNSSQLDPGTGRAGYAVFGSVTAGTGTVQAIADAPCAAVAGFFDCVPTPDMVITSAVQSR